MVDSKKTNKECKYKIETVYSHKYVESKWQKYWEENKTFYTDLENFEKPKKYILPMFPYPSGSGLHVGHVRNYTIVDAMARFYRMMGFNVLTAIGWDSFGLPSEQHAIQTNNHPSLFTYENIGNFREQLIKLGFSYDWSKEINTSEPNYYHWTQWIFKQIYLEKLASYEKIPVFWCKDLSTVLSHEEVKKINGKLLSERGLFPVVKKDIYQWVLKITKYANELSSGLSELDWPLSIKNLQKNWIGISKGVIIKFKVFGNNNFFIEVFTTRSDTIYGVNSIALSPSSSLLKNIVTFDYKDRISKFFEIWEANNSGLNKINKEIFGEFTGSYCLNPLTGDIIPIWITNFVFSDYGTGALMISPFEEIFLKSCKNEDFLNKKEIEQNYRIDFFFSNKFNLPIKKFCFVDKKNENRISYINSPFINNVTSKKIAIEIIVSYLEKNNLGFWSESYHLRDWVFSRQRYWGEPIPIIHLKCGSTKVLEDDELPLKLPSLNDFTPSSKYYSPLQKISDWVNFETSSGFAKRDINVMPQWAGSCWYYIAYLLRIGNSKKNFKYRRINDDYSKRILNHWLNVDLYVGGQEHANLHLLYSRFWHKVLNRIGIVKNPEPFQKLLCQGMILGKNGEKMSKSKGNVVNPDECIGKWGSDALRLYEIFLCPPDQDSNFDINGVASMRKWLNRFYALFTIHRNKFVECEPEEEIEQQFQNMISSVTKSYQSLKLNLIIPKIMEFTNFCYLLKKIPIYYGKSLVKILNPLAPHITEEIWSTFEEESIAFSHWPTFNLNKSKNKENINIVVHINGKKKGVITVNQSNNEERFIVDQLKSNNNFKIREKEILKIIFIKSRLINLLIKD